MRTQALISKYDPIYRIDNTHVRDEWTSYHDIGKQFADGTLTKSQYKQVEGQYVGCILTMAKLCGVKTFRIRNLEIYHRNPKWVENQMIGTDEAELFIRDCLKNYYWGRVVGRNFELKFGQDYYFYINSVLSRDEVEYAVAQHSLFIRDFVELTQTK